MATADTEFEVDRYIQRYLRRVESRWSENTFKIKKGDLKHFQLWMEAEGIDVLSVEAFDIEDYIDYLSREGYAPKTISSRFASLQTLYKYLAKDGRIDLDESPFEDIERKDFRSILKGSRKEKETREQITYLTPEEIDLVTENVPDPKLRNELLVHLMFQIGVREGELAKIRLQDLDREDRSINIHAEKTHNNRTVYWQPGKVDRLLDLWLDGGERLSFNSAADCDYLFISRRRGKMSPQRPNYVVVDAVEKAGLQEVMYVDKNEKERAKYTSHTLRHSHAVEALKSGIDVRSVQKHMGHAKLEMTMKYLRFIEDDVQQAYGRFGTRAD